MDDITQTRQIRKLKTQVAELQDEIINLNNKISNIEEIVENHVYRWRFYDSHPPANEVISEIVDRLQPLG